MKRFDGSFVSFEYPSDWTFEKESEKYCWMRFNTSNGRFVRVGYHLNIADSPVTYENFPKTGTIGNRTYKRIVPNLKSSLVSFVVRENGKDLNVVGSVKDLDGMKRILKTFQFNIEAGS